MYEIQKNITIPERTKQGRIAKYPFQQMEIGDSFFVEGKKANAISNASQWHAKKTGKKFQCSTEANGTRCWRVE